MSKSTPNFIGTVAVPPTSTAKAIKISYQSDSVTKPQDPSEGDILLVTGDGLRTGYIYERWLFDGTGWKQTKGFDKEAGSIIDNTIGNPIQIRLPGKYIVPATGTLGEFVGQENKYVEWDGPYNIGGGSDKIFRYTTAEFEDRVVITTGANAGQVWRFNELLAWEQVVSAREDLIISDYVPNKEYSLGAMVRSPAGDVVVAQGDINVNSPFTLHKLTTATSLRNSTTTVTINDIIYDSQKWVAITSNARLLTSTDGITWTLIDPGLGGVFKSIAHFKTLANTIVLIVVTATGGIFRSTNGGTTWSSRTSGTSSSINRVKYLNGLFIAVGNSGLILTSEDQGSTWTQRTTPTVNNLTDVAFKNGVYVAVGQTGTILRTTDYGTWSTVSSGTTNIFNCITNDSTSFVAGMQDGGARTSLDGVTWQYKNTATSSTLLGINYNGSYFIGVNGLGQIQTSINGSRWVLRDRPITTAFRAVGVTEEKFIAVGDSGRIADVYTGNGWLPVKPSSPKVSIYSANSGQALFTASATTYANSTTRLKLVGANITTKFVNRITVEEIGLTIQEAGLYEVKMDGTVFDFGNAYTPMVFFIGANNTEIAGSKVTVTSGGNIPFAISIVHQFAAGDTIDFRFASTNNEGLQITNAHVTVREF
jgi:hypothetical protein